MKLRGYMIEVEYDGQTLTAEGTNKQAQIALRGQERKLGPVVLDLSEIASVEFKQASPVINGNVIVHAADGKKYQLHFRRKSREQFAELARVLQEDLAQAQP